MPSLRWKFATLITLASLIANEPGVDRLWTAHAACDYPGNPYSTLTTRYTYFTYDFDGRVTQVNSPEGVINYDYDVATGRLIQVCTYNSEWQYGYDALGRLQTVHVIKRNNTVVDETTTYTYDNVGNRASVTLPNGTMTAYKYDDLNRLTNMTHTATNNVLLANYSYQLDATGRRTNAVEVLLQEGSGGYQTNNLTWQFDKMYRLTNEVSVSRTASSYHAYTNQFVYDINGDRLHQIRTGDGARTVDYNYNPNDELTWESDGTTSTAYSYDANGSLTNKTVGTTVNSYTYNLANKLTQAWQGTTLQASYLYNDQGIRVSSIMGSTTNRYLINDNNPTGYAQVMEEKLNGSTSPNMSYVIGDEVLAQCGTTATDPSYFLQDGHGNNRQMNKMDGTVYKHYGYEAYGAVQTSTSSSSAEDAVNGNVTSKLYCGEQYDSTLQMYNLRARYYNTWTGTFNQRDDFEGNNDDPITLHKYLYCGNDPINNSDPEGNDFSLISVVSTMGIIATVASFVLEAVRIGVASYRLLNQADTVNDLRALADAGIIELEEFIEMQDQAVVAAIALIQSIGSNLISLAETALATFTASMIMGALIRGASTAAEGLVEMKEEGRIIMQLEEYGKQVVKFDNHHPIFKATLKNDIGPLLRLPRTLHRELHSLMRNKQNPFSYIISARGRTFQSIIAKLGNGDMQAGGEKWLQLLRKNYEWVESNYSFKGVVTAFDRAYDAIGGASGLKWSP